jgi:uncharacterized protein YggE
MKIHWTALGIALLLTGSALQAQSIQVDSHNRTIELTVQSSIEVEADLVSITVGYHNFSPTYDAAYADNLRVADRILKAWNDAGLPQSAVSTHSLSLASVSEEDLKEMAPPDRKQKQFEATQSWTVLAKPEVAQKLLDIAVGAGANDISDPVWQLSDPDAAEGKAYALALVKAHGIAEQMAKSFGANVGALLYASNQSRAILGLNSLVAVNTSMSTVGKRPATPPPHPVKLLPQKIERSGFVRAIFALE